MSVRADDDVGGASCQQAAELLVSNAGHDPGAVVGARRRMHTEHAHAVRQTQPQFRRQAGQYAQQGGLAQDAADPADPGRHQPVALYQFGASRRSAAVACGARCSPVRT